MKRKSFGENEEGEKKIKITNGTHYQGNPLPSCLAKKNL